MQGGVRSAAVGDASIAYVVVVSARAHTRYRDTVNRGEQNEFRVIGRTTLVLQIPSYLQDGLENSRQQAKLTHEGAGCLANTFSRAG